MKFYAGITNDGITLSIGDEPPLRLTADPDVDQLVPKRSYVYGHVDSVGIIFYVGKGIGRRAWEESRHPLWHRYVEKHLRGKFSVKILADNMAAEDAEALESQWIAQEGEALVNWINFGRRTDFAQLDRFLSLRDENRKLTASARSLEKDRTEEAISIYLRAIENISAYASLQPERGLVGQLLDEERAEFGISGELVILDRLTLCLTRINRHTEAATVVDEYFARYRLDANLKMAEAIQKRVARGKVSASKTPTQ